jgi:two-component system sensor histidine kinase BaeS
MRLGRPWRTLSGRIALGAAAGLVVAAFLFAAVAVGLIRSQTEAVTRADLDRQAIAVGALVSQQAQRAAESGRELRTLAVANLEELAGPRTRLYYVGVLLSPGAPDPTGGLPAGVEAAISPETLARDGVQRIEFRLPGEDTDTIASAAPVVLGEQIVGAVVISRPRGAVRSLWQDVAVRVLLAAAVGLLVALVMVLLLTRRATRPLRQMQTAAARVARGDLQAEVPRGGPQELDEVAAAFNEMVGRLAQRDAMARDFLMRVTHDLRTPLTAIRGHAAALSDGVVPEADEPRSLAAIEGEATRLEVLVGDLLDLAKMDAHRFRLELGTSSPSELLAGAFGALEGEAQQRGVDYVCDVPGDLPSVVTDAARVRQIVANLLDNALRWTPPGGSVRLRARATPAGGILATVSDSGPGVPAREREAIFEPFRSHPTPDGQHGSGLGLAIARQLARALGGDLRLEPGPPGAGARFTLELPARAPDGGVPRGEPSASVSTGG